MTGGNGELPSEGRQVQIAGSLFTVVLAKPAGDGNVDLFALDSHGSPTRMILTRGELDAGLVPANDRGGHPERALTGMWGRWMQHAVPRIRSAVLATRPLKPYAHQDEAVHGHMLGQPRLRFLLADEPGTGKTIMASMFLTEGRRRGLITGNALFVVPAHLVTKWERDLRRMFGVPAQIVTSAMGADPAELDPRYDTWIVSVDLFTHNPDVRRKLAGSRASWSLVVFDEAHRLTPTSQFLAAARQIADRTHHLLLMTATPHRGKEQFFRALMNLLDPVLYPWDPREKAYDDALIPSKLSFLRRMKEELVDHDGQPLFKPRFSETVATDMNPYESAAYDAVMDYVGTYYAGTAQVLAQMIYGKRAASSLHAVGSTLRRRVDALKGPAYERSQPISPVDLMTATGLGVAAEDDDAWTEAEDALVASRSVNKSEELSIVGALLDTLRRAETAAAPSKWTSLQTLLDRHGIRPGQGQLLVFTEFADTARWLIDRFDRAGFTTGILEGAVTHKDRDKLQERFLSGQFQVLVSTDAGGEGIDLQSANVMVNYDLPWSMVRLEQRGGRLHRVGQQKPVHVYHLVAPYTREGRVQQKMLENLDVAGRALSGKVYDLLDATAERAGFDWGQAMLDAQAGRDVAVPAPEALIAAAKQIVAEEKSLATSANVADALERFAADRLEAINPVIVDEMVAQIARSSGWKVEPGPAQGIRLLTATGKSHLPDALRGGHDAMIAADGKSVRDAINNNATGLDDVIVLGPTEDAFQELVEFAIAQGEADLIRGSALVDSASLTSYVLALFDADIQLHDGMSRTTRKAPILIRSSGGQALPVAWESLITIRTAAPGDPDNAGPRSLPPATRHEAHTAAETALRDQVTALTAERQRWIAAARSQLDTTEYRFEESIRGRPLEERKALLEKFARDKQHRLRMLREIAAVHPSAVRLIGWVAVVGGARIIELGYDPDSEQVAIATVVTELESQGFDVDDRQTAGVGYDLYARHRTTREQRLVEVKGLKDDLKPIWLEQNEWAQAQQRGDEYWLYVVDSCASQPTVRLRVQNPANVLGGRRAIERFQIPIAQLRRLIERTS